MAVTKSTEVDKIEIVGALRRVQVRTATVLTEDGAELARNFARKVLKSRSGTYHGSSWSHSDTNVSGEDSAVQAVCGAVWTTAVKNAEDTKTEASSI